MMMMGMMIEDGDDDNGDDCKAEQGALADLNRQCQTETCILCLLF